MNPYYTMLKTIDSDKEQLGLVLPYTMYGKQSMTAYLVGTTDNSEKVNIVDKPIFVFVCTTRSTSTNLMMIV